MSFNHITLFYDKNCSYNYLLNNVKKKLSFSKIIYEKIPIKLSNSKKFDLEISNDRYISEYNDKLLLFNTGDESNIVLLWYNEYGIKKHISIYNGKAIVIDTQSSLYHNIIIQNNETLFSSILCDFQYFNTPYFLKKHNRESFDLNSRYMVI